MDLRHFSTAEKSYLIKQGYDVCENPDFYDTAIFKISDHKSLNIFLNKDHSCMAWYASDETEEYNVPISKQKTVKSATEYLRKFINS